MPCAKLQEYLDQNHVKYVSIKHSPAFTAQEIAGSAHIPGKELAKTVVVKLDGAMALVVLPAPERIRMQSPRGCHGGLPARSSPRNGSSRADSPIARSGPCPPSETSTRWTRG